MEIILVRHGKPEGAVNPRIGAVGFAKWIRNYNFSKICVDSKPPEKLCQLVRKGLIVSSDLARAIHSAKLCSGRQPDLQLKSMREMEITRYKLPFKLRAYTWSMLSRLLWFAGIDGYGESFSDAKRRAIIAAQEIHQLSKRTAKIVVFGHGMINWYVARELIKLGWQGRPTIKRYWGEIILKNETQDLEKTSST